MVFLQLIPKMSSINCKTAGVILYRGTPGGQIPKFWPKMIPNIGIMSITSLFGLFDSTK